MKTLAPASFDLERFERADDACIEVRGRWSGVRGRRFMRPTLTAVAGGREQRILAVLDHKPWIAEDGEIWRAAFPCATDPASLHDAELTVAPDVTVSLATPAARVAASAPAPVRRPRRTGSQRAGATGGIPPPRPRIRRSSSDSSASVSSCAPNATRRWPPATERSPSAMM